MDRGSESLSCPSVTLRLATSLHLDVDVSRFVFADSIHHHLSPPLGWGDCGLSYSTFLKTTISLTLPTVPLCFCRGLWSASLLDLRRQVNPE